MAVKTTPSGYTEVAVDSAIDAINTEVLRSVSMVSFCMDGASLVLSSNGLHHCATCVDNRREDPPIHCEVYWLIKFFYNRRGRRNS